MSTTDLITVDNTTITYWNILKTMKIVVKTTGAGKQVMKIDLHNYSLRKLASCLRDTQF